MIEQIVAQRGIEHVLHFTRLENLESIVTHGLLPRTKLKERGIKYLYNDRLRLDQFPNASSLSISWPNYRMFYPYRCKMPKAQWVVISYKPEILWKMCCVFCRENAASRNESSIPAARKMGRDGIEAIFRDDPLYPDRSVLKIPECFPTNPQAEVLVFGTIPPSYIKEIFFQDQNTSIAVGKKYSLIPCTYNKEYFSARRDYEHWGASPVVKADAPIILADDEVPF